LAYANNHLSRKRKIITDETGYCWRAASFSQLIGRGLRCDLATGVSVAIFQGTVVIDYFAIGVLVLIALLAVARLFPPPDRAQ
jgi:hypothetical protein